MLSNPRNEMLVDNWTLQNAGSFLGEGLTGGAAAELTLSPNRKRFRYAERSEDVINARCLFQLLDLIVFSDLLCVDYDSMTAWKDEPQLAPVIKEGWVVGRSFQGRRAEWLPARARFIEELCVCPAMRTLHRHNVAEYGKSGANVDPFFSQLIWGGAGMLARADLLRIPYVAHPLRTSWYRQVSRLFGPTSAQQRLQEFVGEQRVHVLKRVDHTGFLAKLRLPPVSVLAVQEATTLSQLLTIAGQLRTEYAPLRQWLGEFQRAINDDATADILAREKVLQSVARHIEASCSAFPVGESTLQFGTSWIKATFKTGDPINSLRNQFGVRAALNRLLLAPAGRDVLQKLARLCGEKRSRVGIKFQRDFLGKDDMV